MRCEYWRNDLFKKWHWQLVAEDGTVIAMSREPYPTEGACLAAIRAFQTAIQQVAVMKVAPPEPTYYRTHPANFAEKNERGQVAP